MLQKAHNGKKFRTKLTEGSNLHDVCYCRHHVGLTYTYVDITRTRILVL